MAMINVIAVFLLIEGRRSPTTETEAGAILHAMPCFSASSHLDEGQTQRIDVIARRERVETAQRAEGRTR
jgi:hypothetical protein